MVTVLQGVTAKRYPLVYDYDTLAYNKYGYPLELIRILIAHGSRRVGGDKTKSHATDATTEPRVYI